MIIIGRDRTGPKGKAHILSTPSVRWAFRCPGHMSFVFLEGSHPISSNTPWLSYRCFHGRIPLKSDDLWRSHKICEHFWTKNPRGPPIGSTKAPPLVAARHPQLHSLRPPWAPSRSKCPCASAGQARWSRGGARQGFGFPEKLGEADYRCEPWKNGWELWKNPWFVGIIIDYTYGKKGWGLPYWKNQWNLLVSVVKPIMNLPFGDSLWYWVCHIRDFTCFCYLGKWAFNLWTKTRLSKIQFNEISKGYAILLGLQLVLKLVSLLAIPLNWLGHIADLRATSELRVTSRSQACWTNGRLFPQNFFCEVETLRFAARLVLRWCRVGCRWPLQLQFPWEKHHSNVAISPLTPLKPVIDVIDFMGMSSNCFYWPSMMVPSLPEVSHTIGVPSDLMEVVWEWSSHH